LGLHPSLLWSTAALSCALRLLDFLYQLRTTSHAQERANQDATMEENRDVKLALTRDFPFLCRASAAVFIHSRRPPRIRLKEGNRNKRYYSYFFISALTSQSFPSPAYTLTHYLHPQHHDHQRHQLHSASYPFSSSPPSSSSSLFLLPFRFNILFWVFEDPSSFTTRTGTLQL